MSAWTPSQPHDHRERAAEYRRGAAALTRAINVLLDHQDGYWVDMRAALAGDPRPLDKYEGAERQGYEEILARPGRSSIWETHLPPRDSLRYGAQFGPVYEDARVRGEAEAMVGWPVYRAAIEAELIARIEDRLATGLVIADAIRQVTTGGAMAD